MSKPRKPLERRLDALAAKLAKVPSPPTPQEQADTKRRWEQVLQAYARGEQEPPDSDPETLSCWDTVTTYAPVLEDLYQQGIFLMPNNTKAKE